MFSPVQQNPAQRLSIYDNLFNSFGTLYLYVFLHGVILQQDQWNHAENDVELSSFLPDMYTVLWWLS